MTLATQHDIIAAWKATNIPVALLDCAQQRVLWISESASFLLTENGDIEKAEKLINKQFCLKSNFNAIKAEIKANGMTIRQVKADCNALASELQVALTPLHLEQGLIVAQFHAVMPGSPHFQVPLAQLGWMDFLPDGIIVHEKGKIMLINDSTAWLMRVEKKAELVGKSFATLFPENVQDTMKKRLAQWKQGKLPEVQEFSMNDPNDETIYLEERTVHVNVAGRKFQLTILSNLSKRKHWIHERMRAQLAEEINQILKHEIREHKVTQRELEASRNFNEAVIESSMDMIIAEDENGKISVFNKAAEKQFGYKRDEVLGKTTEMLFVDKQEYRRVRKNLTSQKSIAMEVLNKRKSGEVFTAFLSASRLHSKDGKYLGSMGVSRDISKEKEAAENLRYREELYRDLFDNMSDAYLMVDTKGNLKYWNKAALKLLAVKPSQAGNLNLMQMVKRGQRKSIREQRDSYLTRGLSINNLEFELVDNKGKTRFVQVNSSPVFEKETYVGSRELILDITDKKIAQAEAEAQAAKIRSIFQSSHYLIWSQDLKGRVTSYNNKFAAVVKKLTGHDLRYGDVFHGLGSHISKAERAFWKSKYLDCITSGESQQFECNFLDDDKKQEWYDVFLNPIRNEKNDVVELSGIAHSVTYKKQAEVKIKEQTAKIGSIFNSSAMMIWTLDHKFRVTSYNTNFGLLMHKNLGLELHIGDNFLEKLKPFVRKDLQSNMKQLYTEALQGKSTRFEGMLKVKERETFYIETFLNPIRKEDGSVGELSCMAHEITDKKRIEKQMRESLHEKEILLQEVHHRVKNNLQVISSILNLQSSYVKDENTLSILRESQNRIKSMSFIHESLYQTSYFSSIDFSDYIMSLTKNLVHSYSVGQQSLQLKTNFERVFLNLDQAIPCGLIVNELVSNALKYAFPNGQKGKLQLSIREENGKVKLGVSDNGVGVSEDFNFEETDTLGLQLVFTLIEQLDGEVTFRSKPGVGTEYFITFEKVNERTLSHG